MKQGLRARGPGLGGSPLPARRRGHATGTIVLLATALVGAACGRARPAVRAEPTIDPATLPHAVIPVPASIQISPADTFTIDSTSAVVVAAGSGAEVERIARLLAETIGPPVPAAPRVLSEGEPAPPRSIALALDPTKTALGAEGYELTVTRDQATLTAQQPNGLFYGVQTIRQIFPPSVEHAAAVARRLRMPGVRITDTPRFTWRGAMLDVSRHFLGVDDVKRYIDLITLYKINRLHLHLSDDQGWRIEITSWPNLARHGGSTEVGGGSGGYYTQAQFADIVAYAQSRFVMIVPEIDMPGHTNAALASYPELNCDGVAPPLYTGIRVGFSTVCVERDTVYRFVDDVVREIGALIPTPYFHIGGDEVEKLTHEQYVRFIERVQGIVNARGKRMIGWGEIAPANLVPGTIVQHWKPDSAHLHVARGGTVILSPGSRMYLDMKYDSTTTLGLRWAGLIEIRTAYDWEPATFRPGVPESAILGIEAPLWAETVTKLQDYEFMAFPRLAAVAEVSWSRPSLRSWEDFRLRLAAHGPRLQALGVNFYRSPQIPWAR